MAHNARTTWDEMFERGRTTWRTFKDDIVRLDTQMTSAFLSPFERARDAVGGVFKGFANNIVTQINNTITTFEGLGFRITDAMNWVSDKLTGKKSFTYLFLSHVPYYAQGTPAGGHPGGPAIVGEQGPELVVLPKGASVIPNHHPVTQAMIGSLPAYEEGAGIAAGLASLWDFVTQPFDTILNTVVEKFDLTLPTNPTFLKDMGGGWMTKITAWVGEFIKKLINDTIFGGIDTGQLDKLPDLKSSMGKMIAEANRLMGVPYVWGGGRPYDRANPLNGLDCSSFVYHVLKAGGIQPRDYPWGNTTSLWNWIARGRSDILEVGLLQPPTAPGINHTGIKLLGQGYEETPPRARKTVNWNRRFPYGGVPPGMAGLLNARGPMREAAARARRRFFIPLS
jgi:hypothetical protein